MKLYLTGYLLDIGGSGSLSPVLFNNTVWVSENGVDIEGQRNNLSRPFRNHSAAILAAQPGDCIKTMPGNYSEGFTITKNLFFTFEDGATLTGFVNIAANVTFRNARIVNTDSGGGWCVQMSADNVTLNMRDCVLIGAKDGIKRQLGASGWRVNLYNCDIDTVDDCLQFPNGGGDTGYIYAQDSRFASEYQPAEMGDFNFLFRNCSFDNSANTAVPTMAPIDCIPQPGNSGELMGQVYGCTFICAASATNTISSNNVPPSVAYGAKYLFANNQSNRPWSGTTDFQFSNNWYNTDIA